MTDNTKEAKDILCVVVDDPVLDTIGKFCGEKGDQNEVMILLGAIVGTCCGVPIDGGSPMSKLLWLVGRCFYAGAKYGKEHPDKVNVHSHPKGKCTKADEIEHDVMVG